MASLWRSFTILISHTEMLCYNLIVHNNYKYRLYPSKGQERKMLKTLDECRWLYNHFLEQRKTTFRDTGIGLALYDQLRTLPQIKLERESISSVYSQVLQDVGTRIDLAYKEFFRRVKSGEKPGYPRFRGEGQYSSFCYPQVPKGCKINKDNVYLSKIGSVKLVFHRPLVGTPKKVCIRRASSGKWFMTVTCEFEIERVSQPQKSIGIDVGLNHFATLSSGETIDNPRFFRKEENELAKANRRLSKKPKGTPARSRGKKVVARVHERIANRRKNFAHQESRKIVNRFGLIAVEDLSINRMVHNHCLSKSIMDAAWSEFAQFLSYKAEWAGRKFVAVNPAYTSQNCSSCGHRQVMPLGDRIYNCPDCKLSIDRDLNASLNILALGLQSIGSQSVEAPQGE